jgi:hypothetical protein
LPADLGVRPAGIVVIRPVVGIPYRAVIASVGLWIHHTKCGSRPDEIPVKRLVYINPVKRINISYMVVVIPEPIVEDTHTSKAIEPSAPVGHVNIPDSADPSVIIVKDRKLCDLYHRSIVIILHIGIVVESRIVSYDSLSAKYPGLNTELTIEIKVEFSVGVY